MRTVEQAVAVSEEVISDHFHLTISHWKKYRYDIKTLKELTRDEIVLDVFAQIRRYARPGPPDGLRLGDFFRICLQDHNILTALERETGLDLLPLLTYVVTHELLHVIRFYKFFQFFDVDEAQRADEEVRVHHLTYDLLRKQKLPGMEMIFDFYADHRRTADRIDADFFSQGP